MSEISKNFEKLKISDDSCEQSKKNDFVLNGKKYKDYFDEHGTIASGSFGIVYKASEKSNSSSIFAIKKIPSSEDDKKNVHKECVFLVKINSKFVVKCFDFWIEDNYYLNKDWSSSYGSVSTSESSNLGSKVFVNEKKLLLHIQMELCYKTLKEIFVIVERELNRKESEEKSIIYYYVLSEVFKELVEGLSYLFKHNVIHRDLKPANILISYGIDGRFVKLADFGLSVFHEREDQSHTQGSGTDKYMAPEVEDSRKYGTKADIYSLGIILKELLDVKDYKFDGSECLSSKWKETIKLHKRMTEHEASSRPTCEQIMDRMEFCEIDVKPLIKERKVKLQRKVDSIERSFHLFFIQTKLLDYGIKYYDENGIPSLDYKETKVFQGNIGIVCEAFDNISLGSFAVKKVPISEMVAEKVLKDINIWYKLESKRIVKLESFWIEDNYYLKNNELIAKHNLDSRHEILQPYNTLLLHIQMKLYYRTLKEVIEILNEELRLKDTEVTSPLGYYISSELFIEILESVQYLHEQNVIHRDLKPSNILISYGVGSHFVKITDLCLAKKHIQDDKSLTQIPMNETYTAPEVKRSKPYDTKADIYSLGMICQDLFDFNINETIDENKNLKMNYLNLSKLSNEMVLFVSKSRPNCGKILEDKNTWALSLIRLKELTDLKMNPKVNSIEESFHMFFIQKKLELNS